MKSLQRIQFGFSDAENYRRRENKNFFGKIFLRTDDLEKLCKPNVFFLVGEKGSGKTAYAVHLSNSKYKNFLSSHKFIRETDYEKFINFRSRNNLSVSDYVDVWKVILLLLICESINDKKDLVDSIVQYPKFKALREAVSEYYGNAFNPEIQVAMQFVEDNKVAANILAKHVPIEAGVSAEGATKLTVDTTRTQTNLLYIERELKAALASIRLSENHILFVDGIDIRPSSVAYEDYLQCVKGLANAAWSLNNDVFPSIKDSVGRIKVVLLLRPDIFNSLGLQNRNTKLKDNSVLLNWITSYPHHRSSNLFLMSDRLFSSQQEALEVPGRSWDYYFPFDAETVHKTNETLSSFVVFLRYSFHRPRDILAILDTLKELYVDTDPKKESFLYSDLMSPSFKRAYGTYFLGEIRDSLSFYYSNDEIEDFLKFFEYLEGRVRFTYDEFLEAFVRFTEFVSGQGKVAPSFMKTPEEFLQFMFDQNVVCFIEEAHGGEKFFRWCFIERNITNIAPKVQVDRQYEIHYGLVSALNLGRDLVRRPKRERARAPETKSSQFRGKIKFFNAKGGFGFLVDTGIPQDLYFSKRELESGWTPLPDEFAQFELSAGKNGRLEAVRVRRLKA